MKGKKKFDGNPDSFRDRITIEDFLFYWALRRVDTLMRVPTHHLFRSDAWRHASGHFLNAGTNLGEETVPNISPSCGPHEITSPLFRSNELRVETFVLSLLLQDRSHKEIRKKAIDLIRWVMNKIKFFCNCYPRIDGTASFFYRCCRRLRGLRT